MRREILWKFEKKKSAASLSVFIGKLGCKYNLHLLITFCDNSHKMRISNDCARFGWWSSCCFCFFFSQFIHLFLLFPYDKLKMALLAGFVLIEMRCVRGFHFRTFQTYLSILLAMSHIAVGFGAGFWFGCFVAHSFGSFWLAESRSIFAGQTSLRADLIMHRHRLAVLRRRT